MNKTYEEYKQYFEEKTGDKCITPEGFSVYYLPNRGFAEYAIHSGWKMLMICNVSGDGRFWYDVGKLLCRLHNMKYLGALTSHNINAFARLFGFRHPKIDGNLVTFTNEAGETIVFRPEYIDDQKKQVWSATVEVSNV